MTLLKDTESAFFDELVDVLRTRSRQWLSGDPVHRAQSAFLVRAVQSVIRSGVLSRGVISTNLKGKFGGGLNRVINYMAGAMLLQAVAHLELSGIIQNGDCWLLQLRYCFDKSSVIEPSTSPEEVTMLL